MSYLKLEHFQKFAPEGAKIKRLSSKACEIETNDICYIVYVGTPVFIFDKKTHKITLNSGGWKTMTTKKRINYGLKKWAPYYLLQRRYIWYIIRNEAHLVNESIEFFDGIEL